MIDLVKLKSEIELVYKQFPLKRLVIFGFALTQDFGLENDVDVLVVFNSDENIDLFDKYFELKEQPETTFEREVDLVIDKPFRNPVFRESV
ncbi:MAG: nucleotidyltransferase family protein [Candidatus Loosdrechtia sp.]|uniref:nucleotidyltransferase family protein n=1 Tax=Candidatus Loosdrechtia sp. TaxID=3101272 RepID=UPI003A6941C4|nr:MAG: nucleotidyltransferase domain-containing protein [Candidatus Jettenia sp. AMX2]